MENISLQIAGYKAGGYGLFVTIGDFGNPIPDSTDQSCAVSTYISLRTTALYTEYKLGFNSDRIKYVGHNRGALLCALRVPAGYKIADVASSRFVSPIKILEEIKTVLISKYLQQVSLGGNPDDAEYELTQGEMDASLFNDILLSYTLKPQWGANIRTRGALPVYIQANDAELEKVAEYALHTNRFEAANEIIIAGKFKVGTATTVLTADEQRYEQMVRVRIEGDGSIVKEYVLTDNNNHTFSSTDCGYLAEAYDEQHIEINRRQVIDAAERGELMLRLDNGLVGRIDRGVETIKFTFQPRQKRINYLVSIAGLLPTQKNIGDDFKENLRIYIAGQLMPSLLRDEVTLSGKQILEFHKICGALGDDRFRDTIVCEKLPQYTTVRSVRVDTQNHIITIELKVDEPREVPRPKPDNHNKKRETVLTNPPLVCKKETTELHISAPNDLDCFKKRVAVTVEFADDGESEIIVKQTPTFKLKDNKYEYTILLNNMDIRPARVLVGSPAKYTGEVKRDENNVYTAELKHKVGFMSRLSASMLYPTENIEHTLKLSRLGVIILAVLLLFVGGLLIGYFGHNYAQEKWFTSESEQAVQSPTLSTPATQPIAKQPDSALIKRVTEEIARYESRFNDSDLTFAEVMECKKFVDSTSTKPGCDTLFTSDFKTKVDNYKALVDNLKVNEITDANSIVNKPGDNRKKQIKKQTPATEKQKGRTPEE